jgi:Family of unknown function (DUF6515)/Bacterial SH3 domain
MKTRFSIKCQLPALMMFLLFFLMSTVWLSSSWAQDFRPKGHPRPFYPPAGVRVRALPAGHQPIHVGPLVYFFWDGIFYRHAAQGYAVAAAPIGAVVPVLPAPAVWITIGAMTYYTYADVYYQKVSDGYAVVPPPVKSIQPDKAVAWEGDQVRVTVPILNVRSGPGTEHPVIKEVQLGDILMVRSSSSGWYYVKLPDASLGWVMVKFTALLKPKAMG